MPVFGVRVKLLTAMALACTALAPAHSVARTISDLPDIESDRLGGFSLAELLREDPLGGDCIAEDDIDLAFFAAGKGLRLPRTCLPEPCDEALTPFRLAELIGRPASPEEWEQYFSRYADVCRKEIVSFEDEISDPGPTSRTEFWAPILGSQVSGGRSPAQPAGLAGPLDWALRTTAPQGPFFSGSGGSGSGGSSGDSSGGSSEGGDRLVPTTFGPPGDGDPAGTGLGPDTGSRGTEPDPDTPALSPVPLPLTAWMLLSALGGLALVRKRDR